MGWLMLVDDVRLGHPQAVPREMVRRDPGSSPKGSVPGHDGYSPEDDTGTRSTESRRLSGWW